MTFPAVVGSQDVEADPDRPPWLPAVHLEDFECRRPRPSSSVVDWPGFRSQLRELAQRSLDPMTFHQVEEPGVFAWRLRAQISLLTVAAHALMNFEAAVRECPMGALAASVLLACLAHVPLAQVTEGGDLPPPLGGVLADVAKTPFNELVARDLRALLEMAPVYVIAATEWKVFALLHLYGALLRPSARSAVSPAEACAGASVAGHESEKIRYLLRTNIHLASGKEISGLKFLRALDPLVTSVMKDPTEYKTRYLVDCPAGAAAFAVTSTILALMSNPSLFERFAHTAHYAIYHEMEAVLSGAEHWGLFHGLAKLGSFATRAFDLVWSPEELLPLPSDAQAFDRLRLDASARRMRLDFASRVHPHGPTRALARFLTSLSPPKAPRREQVVYLTAVGGLPFSNYIDGFIARAVAVGLPALVIVCMDVEADTRCRAFSAQGDAIATVHCVAALEGHVVLVKHAFIPALLSMAVDTVWVDFDTFIVRDPTDTFLEARDSPQRLLPFRDRVRFGSFLFDDAADLCNLTKICDKRMYWPFDIGGGDDSSGEGSAEMLVTEHWDARCLNNGLFYVQATHRPLAFFMLFLAQLHSNPYADNQNLFDSFLSHSTFDTTAPAHRPFLRYAVLDVSRRFGCADGHAAEDVDELVTFHFWTSDFRTREVAPASTTSDQAVVGIEGTFEGPSDAVGVNDASDSGALGLGGSNALRSKIRTKSGVERVSKVRATKSELFEMFFGGGASNVVAGGAGVPALGAAFMRQVRSPPPLWKGMCSVTAVGVEELVDERLLQSDQATVDWDSPSASERMDDLFGVPTAASAGKKDEVEPTPPPPTPPQTSPEERTECSRIPLREWAAALRVVGVLEDEALLTKDEASMAKEHLRRLDVGSLLTMQAYGNRGRERLAAEVRQSLADSERGHV